jgi:hypothetical protein
MHMFSVQYLISLLQMQFSLLPTLHAYLQTKEMAGMWYQERTLVKVQKTL